MLYSSAAFVVNQLQKHCYIDEKQRPIYIYGFELLLTRIILESGLIGHMIKGNVIAENHLDLKNPEPLCVLVTDFNFSVSATLSDYTLRKEQQYILHPMCFENYKLLYRQKHFNLSR